METKPLLYGLIGFFIGGLIVSIAATTLVDSSSRGDMTMSEMTADLSDKKGDEFDKAFIQLMIEHHQGAVEMAKLSASNAKHDEIKHMSEEIISAQSREIDLMQSWQVDWGYKQVPTSHSKH